MVSIPMMEGEIDFDAPGAGKLCKTYYRIVGSIGPDSPSPLVVLHGGPGVAHQYMNSLTDIYKTRGIPIVFYDQIGCGRSTHLQEKLGDMSFWTFELFYKELDNLIDYLHIREKGFYLLGHSWGGMWGGSYASRRPKGLLKLILAGARAGLAEEGTKVLLAGLPSDTRETIENCVSKRDFESAEYQKAMAVFFKRHLCTLDPLPEDVQAAFRNLGEDPTVSKSILGPSFFLKGGLLKDWEGWKDAHNIEVETLLTNGRYDTAPDVCVAPWFKTIQKVRWVTFEKSSHMPHYEERERYMKICGDFLTSTVP
ncbi:Alpha/Beta hydrolase protein [Xylariales sp. PMI_506]|nr:Alpha/Beta hydrolase protein [Xylariales sp. PMI_506]